MASYFLFISLFTLFISQVCSESNPVQDFCVADLSSRVFVDGFACKNPNIVTVDDFFFSGLDKPGNTGIYKGVNVTSVTVKKLPGLNTLGISLARHDFAPGGMVPPHYHPRATEIFVLIEGTIEVGMISSIDNKHFSKVLKKGDLYVFPQGMIHYKSNNDKNINAVAFSALSSQNPGEVFVAGAAFGSKPWISDDVLAKAFRLDKKTVGWLQAQFTHDDAH